MLRLRPSVRNQSSISVSDFYDAFNRLWIRLHGRPRPGSRIAIAVSGGVDSMALAQLCTLFQHDTFAQKTYGFHFQAFIVDHRAREGSKLEAISVKQKLFHMGGLHATILDLQWPPNVRPSDLPDFETQARRLRYQALGSACQAQHITRLLVAHHADDQAETVLMRLASGQKGIGLRGIRGCAPIPECWGIHGSDSSGRYEQADAYHKRRLAVGRSSRLTTFAEQSGQQILSSPPIFETGGIFVLRPLLDFHKQDLVDTCVSHGIEWEEDQTNKDVRRTTRNAIRGSLADSSLPAALQKGALLRLSLKMNGKAASHNNAAAHHFKRTKILLFDLRSGVVVFRLPENLITERDDSIYHGGFESISLVASMLIRRLVKLVTPQEDVPLHSLQFAVTAMFPKFRRLKEAGHDQKSESAKFTAADIQFERIRSPMAGNDSDKHSGYLDGSMRQRRGLDPEFIWSLTRQPFKIDDYKSTITIPGAWFFIESKASEPSSWSSWHLWDGRYWIRVMNHSTYNFEVRPFDEHDLHSIRKDLSKSKLRPLEEVLKSAAPGKIRWTLPAIAHSVQDSAKPGKVIALPSLGKVGVLDVEDEKGERIVEWEIRYKFIDLGRIHLEDKRKNKNLITSWEDS